MPTDPLETNDELEVLYKEDENHRINYLILCYDFEFFKMLKLITFKFFLA